MNQFDFEENISEEGEVEFQPVYNRHFIELDEKNNIIKGFSDAFSSPTSNSILLTDEGSLHFRLFADGEQNPNLYTMDGIPLYKWDGEQVVARTEAEIEADRMPALTDLQSAKLDELSVACSQAIVAGCDVELSNASGHISLTAEDQINLTAALNAVEQGAVAYPYHLDGQLCAMFLAEDIRKLAVAASGHKLYHTTYYNHLAAWVHRCTEAAEVQAITYGAELPEDLAANMTAILGGVAIENNL